MINIEQISPGQVRTLLARQGKIVDDLLLDRALEIWTVSINGDLVLIGGGLRESLLGATRLWVVLMDDWQKHRTAFLRLIPRLADLALKKVHKIEAFAEQGRGTRFLEFAGLSFVETRDKYARYEA